VAGEKTATGSCTMANDWIADESSGDCWELASEFHRCGLPVSRFLGWPRNMAAAMLHDFHGESAPGAKFVQAAIE
jgi:hypothetical protein